MDNFNSSTTNEVRKPNKHFTDYERGMIQLLHRQGKSLRHIAGEINCSPSAVHYELKRGTRPKVGVRGPKPQYNAAYASKVYKRNRQRCRKPLKIDSPRHEPFILWCVDKIRNLHWSIDACVGFARKENIFQADEIFCTKTMYNYLWSGKLPITIFEVPKALKRKHRRKWKRRNKRILGRSIEERPAYIDDRQESGHWEADTVVGKRAGKESVILTLLERKTRHYLAIKIDSKTSGSVNAAMAVLKEEYGDRFSEVFKTITTDNGAEFEAFSALEAYGSKIYFAHPYMSSDKAQNERHNGLLREYVSKGESIDNYTAEDILSFADTINALPRRVLGYNTPEMLFEEFLDQVYAC